MIEINLVPAAAGPRLSSRRTPSLSMPALPALGGDPRALGAGAAAVLAALIALYSYWSLSARQTTLEQQVQEEVQDSARFATTLAMVQTLEARQDTIRQRIAVIREVDQRRYVWPHLLDEVSASVPRYTWLTQISSLAADSLHREPSLSIQGNTGSTQALTRFMKNLELSPFIRDVTLVTSEQQSADGRTFHKFTLEARYEAPDSTAIATVPVVSVN